MTLTDFLLNLHELLIDARTEHKVDKLRELMSTFVIMEDVICGNDITPIRGILTHLYDSARDSLMEVEFKSEIPTPEEIAAAFKIA